MSGAFAHKLPELSASELLDRLLSFKTDVADLAERHANHREHIAAVGERIDRFLAACGKREN